MVIHRHKDSSGKRVIVFLFIAMVALAGWWMKAPVETRRHLLQDMRTCINRLFFRDSGVPKTKKVTGVAFRAKTIDQSAPPAMMISDEPAWAAMAEKQRYLQPEAVLNYQEALAQKLRLDKIVDLEAGTDGLLYALHAANMRVYVFSKELKLVRSWPLRLGHSTQTDRFLDKPVALACASNEIIVVSEKGHAGRWLPDGTFRGEFSVPYSVRHVRIFPNGDLLLVAPGNRFLLHRVSSRGMEKLAFAMRDSANSPTAKIFDRAMAAILPDGSVVVSYEYPYRLEFFDSAGNPISSLSLPLSLMLVPPEIERDSQGRVTRIFRQIAAFDLQIGPDSLIYHLVRLRGVEGGNQWDIFSTHGEFLQRFYLPYNQRAFCFSLDAVYVLGAYPHYKLEKFIITKLTSAEQLSSEWLQNMQPK
jgi:hypothetical protein